MNDLTIIGNVTRKPTRTTTPNGSTVATVGVAINDGFGENAKSTYLDLDAWDGKAILASNLEPGQTCIFTCKTKVKKYVDGQGQNRKALQPTIQEINPIESGVRMASKQEGRYLGHLTAHPVREGRRVRFSIRIDDTRTEVPEYMDCVAFEPLATTVERHTTAHTQVVVSGRFEIEKYTTRDGKTGDSIRLLVDKNGLVIGWPKRGDSAPRSNADFDELEPLTPMSTAVAAPARQTTPTPVPIEDVIDIDAPFDAPVSATVTAANVLISNPISEEDKWMEIPF